MPKLPVAGTTPAVQALELEAPAEVELAPLQMLDAPQLPAADPAESRSGIEAAEPLRAPSGVWTYIEIADTRCRDGSPAGVSVRLQPQSPHVLIYLEGGVYCFDQTTCLLNPSNVSDLLFNSAKREPTAGIFDTRNSQNPVRDWNIVYIPYCTGDAMAGVRTSPTDVPNGPKGQWFTGRSNLQTFLRRIVPTFPNVKTVLLTGMSAGGSAVLASISSVASAFAPLPVRFVNDSSLPPASGEVLPACLQQKMRDLWGLDDTLLAECGDACPNRDDFWRDYTRYITKTFADRPNGYIGAVQDEMMRMVAGLGSRNCQGTLLFDTVPAAPYRTALLDYRESIAEYSTYSTFFPDDTRHTWLKDNSFYTGRAGTTTLPAWFARIANGEVAGHAGP